MKLFKIMNPILGKRDTFQSAVVVAASEAEARLIHPDGYFWAGNGWVRLITLVSDEDKAKIFSDSRQGNLRLPSLQPPTWGWKDSKGLHWVALAEREAGWPSDPSTVIVEFLGDSARNESRVVMCDLLEVAFPE